MNAVDPRFGEIDELGTRDGSNLTVEGYDVAPSFSVWTTIEECLNPPVIWERERGWFTTPPFGEPEVFDFPGGVGPVECGNVEHEEVLLMPRWVDCRRVTFKCGLGEELIEVLRVLHELRPDRTERIRVGGVEVAPRDVVAAALPDPATLGDRMSGKTCAGLSVTGTGTDGRPRSTYLCPRPSTPCRSEACSPTTARRGASGRAEPTRRRRRCGRRRPGDPRSGATDPAPAPEVARRSRLAAQAGATTGAGLRG